jgi:AcrR family transcriptional regulator
LRRHELLKLVLDAAHYLCSKKGLNFTTIRKIAKKTDYSPASIYLYYPSKDLIFYDMQELAFESLHKALQSVDVSKGRSAD